PHPPAAGRDPGVLRELPRLQRPDRAAQPRAHRGAHRALRARAPGKPRPALQRRPSGDARRSARHGPRAVNPVPVLTNEESRAVEERSRTASPSLMERAGRAVAQAARRLASDTGAPILVVAGPGNNGGDAWVAAAHLMESFHRLTVLDVAGTAPKANE